MPVHDSATSGHFRSTIAPVAIKASSSQTDRRARSPTWRPTARSTREAAVARLTVLGARAVERLIALGRIGDGRRPRASRRCARSKRSPTRARSSRRSTRWRRSRPGGRGAAAGVARSVPARRARRRRRRSAHRGRARSRTPAGPAARGASQALATLEPATIAPLLDVARATIRARRFARGRKRRPHRSRARDRADPVRDVLGARPSGSCPTIRSRCASAIATVGGRRPAAAAPADRRARPRARRRGAGRPREEWTTARAAAHVALASRGSRLALYDLRESLERATRRCRSSSSPRCRLIGDASCLEAIAAAHATGRARRDWWREHLADAFRAIVDAREADAAPRG